MQSDDVDHPIGGRQGAPRVYQAEAQKIVGDDLFDILDGAKAMPPGFWLRLDQQDPLSHALRIDQEWIAELTHESADKIRNPFGLGLASSMKTGWAGQARWSFSMGASSLRRGGGWGYCVASYSTACHAGTSRIISLHSA